MSEKFKKILIIILFILVIIGIGVLLYVIFLKKPVVSPPITPVEEEKVQPRLPSTKESWETMTIQERLQKGLPALEWPSEELEEITAPIERVVSEIDEVANGRETWITPVSNQPVKGASLSADGINSVYYDPESGQFYSMDRFGNKELLSDQVFYNIDTINWSPKKNKAIIQYPDGFKVMYDFDKKKQYTLPKNWEDFSWDNAGSKIAFKSIGEYAENSWLAIASPDASQAKPIEHLGDNADKVTVSWSPNNQIVAFSSTGDPRGTWEQEMILIGQNQENFRSLIIDGRGFEPKWAPQGDKLVYSVYSADSSYQPRLYLVNSQVDEIGNDKKNLNLMTWAHKCAFNQTGNTLYCAVPKELPEGAGLVLELGEDARDDFYKIDVASGRVSFLAEGAMGGYNVEEMYLSDDEAYLYFIDKKFQKLRYIKLK